ncbi:MAG: helical backbone metal receptor, partial [Flammeovirgaceae bacterium]
MVKSFTDQLNRIIQVSYPPRRIVSLVPSQTELLFDLGLHDAVVGVTKFCVHPAEKVKSITKVGGTKNFRLDVIRRLRPDLIIGNKEENYQQGIEALEQEFAVWMSDISSLKDAYQMIAAVGQLTDTENAAQQLLDNIQKSYSTFQKIEKRKVLYLIWKSPWMAAGKDTFIDSMLTEIGLQNVLVDARYPQLTLSQIQELQPELIFLSSEPFPFKEQHVNELRAALPTCIIQLVDGEMFSWYGSR